MKKILCFISIALFLLLTQTAFAEVKLTQPVVDLIKSNKYLIKFSLSSEMEGFKVDKAVQHHMNNTEMRNEYTVVFDGQNALTITDSCVSKPMKMHMCNAMLFCDGESYMIIPKGKGVLYSAMFGPNVKNIQQITHFVGSNNKQGKSSFESVYRQMMYWFLPLFPELNTTTDLQGKAVPLNPCTVYSKSEEVNYGGQKYQIEKYITPNDYVSPTIIRYCFKDGKLFKIIQQGIPKEIDAAEDWKNAFGTNKMKLGHLVEMDVIEITDTFNGTCLQVPQGIKIIDSESLF